MVVRQNLFYATFKTVFLWVFLVLILMMLAGAVLVLKPFLDNHSETISKQILEIHRQAKFNQEKDVSGIDSELLQVTTSAPAYPQISWLPFNLILADKLSESPDIYKATIYFVTEDTQHYWVKLDDNISTQWVIFDRELIGTKPLLTIILLLIILAVTSGVIAWIIANKQKLVYQQLARQALKIGQSKQPVEPVYYDIVEVQTMFNSLKELSETLRRADQDKAVLLAGISHDLRTPITRLYLLLALEEHSLPYDFIKNVELELKQVEQLIDLFLDHSQVNYHEGVAFEERELTSWLQTLCDRYNQPKRLHCIQPTQPVYFPINAPVLTRVMQNLIDNALKHTTGQIDLSIEYPSNQPLNSNGSLALVVRDYGNQIKAEQLLALQTPFDQGTKQIQGAGLGTSIIQYLCQQQGWQCLYENANPGIKATVRLPIETFST